MKRGKLDKRRTKKDGSFPVVVEIEKKLCKYRYKATDKLSWIIFCCNNYGSQPSRNLTSYFAFVKFYIIVFGIFTLENDIVLFIRCVPSYY